MSFSHAVDVSGCHTVAQRQFVHLPHDRFEDRIRHEEQQFSSFVQLFIHGTSHGFRLEYGCHLYKFEIKSCMGLEAVHKAL